MKKLFALVSILIVVLASCRPKGGMDADTGYYSITALRDSLAKGKPVYKFKKTLVVDGKEETQLITDSLHLQIYFFEDFEINKPSYKGAYTVSTEREQDIVDYRKYMLNPDFKYPVKEFSYAVNNKHTTIKATSIVNNLLTTITKQLVVDSDSTGFIKYFYSVTEEMRGSETTNTKITLERIP